MSVKSNDSISVLTVPFILIFVAILLFAALLQRETDLVLFSASILGITGFARIWSILSLKNLDCCFSLSTPRCFNGDSIELRVNAANRKLIPVMVKISAPYSTSDGLEFSENEPREKVEGLLWYQEAVFQWRIEARKRGIHSIGPFFTSTGDFFGFFMKEKKNPSIKVKVYPRIFPVEDPEIQRMDLFGKAGKQSPVQDPVYILGTREYQHWQPAKNIHWKASARYNRLMEKIFDPSEQEKVMVVIDATGFFEAGADELFEKTIEAAASLLYKMSTSGYITGFITNAELKECATHIIKPGRNSSQITRILETMAGMNMMKEQDLRSLLTEGFSLSSGTCFLMLGYSSQEVSDQCDFLREKRIRCSGIAAVMEETKEFSNTVEIHLLENLFAGEQRGLNDPQ